jgi:hypothetical protein
MLRFRQMSARALGRGGALPVEETPSLVSMEDPDPDLDLSDSRWENSSGDWGDHEVDTDTEDNDNTEVSPPVPPRRPVQVDLDAVEEHPTTPIGTVTAALVPPVLRVSMETPRSPGVEEPALANGTYQSSVALDTMDVGLDHGIADSQHDDSEYSQQQPGLQYRRSIDDSNHSNADSDTSYKYDDEYNNAEFLSSFSRDHEWMGRSIESLVLGYTMPAPMLALLEDDETVGPSVEESGDDYDFYAFRRRSTAALGSGNFPVDAAAFVTLSSNVHRHHGDILW